MIRQRVKAFDAGSAGGDTGAVLPPLVLTGAPAVGKSTTAGVLARGRTRAAVVDVDDVRLMVVAGHEPPWAGREGVAQQRLGVENTCALARRFGEHGFEVVIADVLTPDSAALYRQRLPAAVLVRLHVAPQEAHRRAGTRPVYLSDAEFEHLHAQDRDDPPPVDHDLDVTAMDVRAQVAAVAALWQDHGTSSTTAG